MRKVEHCGWREPPGSGGGCGLIDKGLWPERSADDAPSDLRAVRWRSGRDPPPIAVVLDQPQGAAAVTVGRVPA
jgi:hypothetical protein